MAHGNTTQTWLYNPKTQRLFFFLLLVGAFLGGLAASLGQIFARGCYANVCPQAFFPSETLVHIGVFYAWLLLTGLFLWSVRTESCWSRFWDRSYRVPFGSLGTWHPSLMELLFWFWLFGLLGLAAGTFWGPMWRYWTQVIGQTNTHSPWIYLVTFTGISGHWCDVLLGLIFLSIGRNSVLSHLFRIPAEHSIYYHKLIAYLLLIAVLAHMVPYWTTLGMRQFVADIDSKSAFDNPYFIGSTLKPWQAPLLGSGIFALVLILIMTITALPFNRTAHYNTFYFTHFLFVGVLVAACFHAATDFYLVLPGLLSYIVDGLIRLFNLKKTFKASLIREPGQDDLFRIQMKDQPKRWVPSSPFCYFINIPKISKRELHPFTSPSAPQWASQGTELSFLFRPVSKSVKKLEWTQKVAQLFEDSKTLQILCEAQDAKSLPMEKIGKGTEHMEHMEHMENTDNMDNMDHTENVEAPRIWAMPREIEIEIRMEGPYYTPLPNLIDFGLVLCIVGGTGITGALSLAHYVIECVTNRNSLASPRCVILWSTRETPNVAQSLKNVQDLLSRPKCAELVTLVIHNTKSHGRVDVNQLMEIHLKGVDKPKFVYTSGPLGLMESVAQVCRKREKTEALFWHEAKWDS